MARTAEAFAYALPPKGFESAESWSKFPVTRPVNKPILVVHENEVKAATGCNCPRTGGAIRIDGKLVDSNHVLWWRYA